eukprot:g637.t1
MGACISRLGMTNGILPTAASFGLPKNFTVLKELGYGNEGRTFLIQERKPDGNHLFACKMLPRGVGICPEFILKGLRNQSCLRFVNVVQFLEILLTRTHLIIKFEYVRGGDLFDYLCRQRSHSKHLLLSEEHARYVFIQILFGLHYCHGQRVAHRDITLTNILCTKHKNPVIKICDFGLSKGWAAAQDAQSFSAVGSLWFMSPELISRFNQGTSDEPYDPRKADIWSLGVILYAMLLGRFPLLTIDGHESNSTTAGGSYNSHANLIGGSSASLSFLMRRIERALRFDPQRLMNEIDSMDFLSNEVQQLLKSMLTLNADDRISLNKLLEHKWVKGPFHLARGKALASILFSEGNDPKQDDIDAPHLELIMGSPADEELRRIVESATHPGNENESMVRWSSPVLRFHPDITLEESIELEREGIRRCKWSSITSEGFPYAGFGLPIIHHRS